MSFAALSTVIAVFECIIAFLMDQWDLPRQGASLIVGAAIAALAIPCALGFNVWSDFTLPGIGDIQSIEDFIVSNNLLPIGSLIFLLFCTSKSGWGWENFLAEADAGEGAKFPRWAFKYVRYGIPALVVVVLVMGWIPVVSTWIG